MFLRPESLEYDNHTIHPDLRLISDYALLTTDISIFEEQIQTRRHMLIKNSDEKNKFINKLIENIKEMNILCINNKSILKQIIQEFASIIERTCKYSKIVNITKHSKKWWND